ncbi:MAG: DUF1707 domain-containing protein [Actinobacteria bacterium]|nr:MAG: DUF1707 domain-containing protein [Actinomycetota bacterium]
MAGALPNLSSLVGVGIRASDEERERMARSLRRHFAAGRLSAEELEERLQCAYAARSRAELARLTVDLPSDRRVRRLLWMHRVQRRTLRYHAAAYVSANGTLVGIWALTGEHGFWPAGVLAPWTVMLAWHAVGSVAVRRALRAAGEAGPRRARLP